MAKPGQACLAWPTPARPLSQPRPVKTNDFGKAVRRFWESGSKPGGPAGDSAGRPGEAHLANCSLYKVKPLLLRAKELNGICYGFEAESSGDPHLRIENDRVRSRGRPPGDAMSRVPSEIKFQENHD